MQSIAAIPFFEKVLGAKVKDCFFEDGTVVFLVQQGQMGKIRTRQGWDKVQDLGRGMGKKIQVLEFHENPEVFVLQLLHPLHPKTEWKDGVLTIHGKDAWEKGQIFGREKTRYRKIQELIKKYFHAEVRVQ